MVQSPDIIKSGQWHCSTGFWTIWVHVYVHLVHWNNWIPCWIWVQNINGPIDAHSSCQRLLYVDTIHVTGNYGEWHDGGKWIKDVKWIGSTKTVFHSLSNQLVHQDILKLSCKKNWFMRTSDKKWPLMQNWILFEKVYYCVLAPWMHTFWKHWSQNTWHIIGKS
jgi:hypothetical protein